METTYNNIILNCYDDNNKILRTEIFEDGLPYIISVYIDKQHYRFKGDDCKIVSARTKSIKNDNSLSDVLIVDCDGYLFELFIHPIVGMQTNFMYITLEKTLKEQKPKI